MSDIEDNLFDEEEYFDEEDDLSEFSEENEFIEEKEEKDIDENEEEKEKNLEDDEENEIDEDDDDEVIELEKEEHILYEKTKVKVSLPILTKYEKAKLIGLRAIQISKGMKPRVHIKNMIDPIEIAEEEFKMKKLPLIIRRHLPNGIYEDWRLEEFKNI